MTSYYIACAVLKSPDGTFRARDITDQFGVSRQAVAQAVAAINKRANRNLFSLQNGAYHFSEIDPNTITLFMQYIAAKNAPKTDISFGSISPLDSKVLLPLAHIPPKSHLWVDSEMICEQHVRQRSLFFCAAHAVKLTFPQYHALCLKILQAMLSLLNMPADALDSSQNLIRFPRGGELQLCYAEYIDVTSDEIRGLAVSVEESPVSVIMPSQRLLLIDALLSQLFHLEIK